MTFRILIDTNTIINLEDNRVLEERYTEFSRRAQEIGQLLVHPKSREDIDRDMDEERKSRTLSKIDKYPLIDSPPVPSKEFIDLIKPGKPNDEVDANLLYAIKKNSVHFLVTEDGGIHTKARRFGLSENVLTIGQALAMLKQLTQRDIPPHSVIKHGPIHDIDLEDSFFDSLRDDYDVFNGWFQSKSKEGRNCWFLDDKTGLLAVCIYNEENSPDSHLIPTPTLKLCTFKVGESASGRKLSELMLKLAFQYAHHNGLKSVYLTILPKYKVLLSILDDFGFCHIDNKGEEFIMMKPMDPSVTEKITSPLDFLIKLYPHYLDGPEINKFVVPIKPPYHERLFPDTTQARPTLYAFSDVIPEGTSSIDHLGISSEGNTIKKAYICNAPTQQIRDGDVLLFYRSRDRREVTSIGVVEGIYRTDDPYAITAIVSNRTVYSFDEISDLASRTALVVIFRHIGNLNTPVDYTVLTGAGIEGSIQSIRQISNAQYCEIMEVAKGCS